jgi:uncharacterized RmlC-like cupin family protein
VVRAGETLHIPSNAPHQFRNTSDQAAVHLLARGAGRFLPGSRCSRADADGGAAET